MVNDALLNSLLEASASKALEKIKANQAITAEEAMPLLLKAQFNHIAHLDETVQFMMSHMATKEDLQRIDGRFAKIDERFAKIDERFAKIDERFERVFDKLQTNLYWTVGTIVAVSGIVFGLLHWPLS